MRSSKERVKAVPSFAINSNRSDGTRGFIKRIYEKHRRIMIESSSHEEDSRREERAKGTLRATATSSLKAAVTLAAIQPFGPPASQPEMCFIAASFPFSIGPCNARAAAPLRRSTSRTPAVMATPCRIRERSDQRSKRAEKIVRGKPSENSPAICEARCN